MEFCVSLLGLSVVIVSNELYRNSLYKWSLSNIPVLQSKLDSKGFEELCKMMSSLGGGVELTFLLFFFFLLSSRPKAFYFAFVMGLDKMQVNLMKNIYAAPRPYLENRNIKPLSCSKEYGNPSGHSSAAMTFSVVLLLEYFRGKTMNEILGKKIPPL